MIPAPSPSLDLPVLPAKPGGDFPMQPTGTVPSPTEDGGMDGTWNEMIDPEDWWTCFDRRLANRQLYRFLTEDD